VIRAAWPIAVLVALMVGACEISGSAQNGPALTTFDGNKKLELFAGYTLTSASINITVWADLPAGAAGTIEMTGTPFHVRCQGQFQRPEPGFQVPDDDLSYLDVGAGHAGAFFGAPPGHYTATARIPSKGASIKKSFVSGQSFPDGKTGVFNLPLGCVPVADTKEQLGTLLPKYVSAIQILAGTVPSLPLQGQISEDADKARAAVAAGDASVAIDALDRVRDIVQPLHSQGPYYQILLNAQAAIALLTQSPPRA